ncbi:type II secretion system F family protein [Amphritea balenae]|uniref:Type II secretion system F family protein n=1 Tax=Amphritea balenae TaxID=452629 RepID=A0A3P1SVD6_9GAMM|nr:type II secretion system F family protein [Amphritea balenae]RRD01184.1 type II secretion system F family protein [Amphritea balenae]GGK59240.1 pilus assembly protein TadB [Amphritea balenae]
MSEQTIFIAMVFIAVFMLVMGLTVPVFGENSSNRSRIRKRIKEMLPEADAKAITVLLRKKYLKSLSPTERWLESLPGMETLADMLEKAGYKSRAYQLVFGILLITLTTMILAWLLTRIWLVVAVIGICTIAVPFIKIIHARRQRIAIFEENLPDAIDVMKRAVKAGHPFSDALRLVGEEMEGPVAQEFKLTFADLNYGNDLRRALLGLLHRVPSVTVMVLVSSILIQKETGGNLTEILEQISRVIRSRFRFNRRVKTLSAEGRLSAWILALVPFALFIIIGITTPDYIPMLLDDPLGLQMIVIAFFMMMTGIIWIRNLLRIEV